MGSLWYLERSFTHIGRCCSNWSLYAYRQSLFCQWLYPWSRENNVNSQRGSSAVSKFKDNGTMFWTSSNRQNLWGENREEEAHRWSWGCEIQERFIKEIRVSSPVNWLLKFILHFWVPLGYSHWKPTRLPYSCFKCNMRKWSYDFWGWSDTVIPVPCWVHEPLHN